MISQLGGSCDFPRLAVAPSTHPRQRDCLSCCFCLHSQELVSLYQAQSFGKPAATSLGQAQSGTALVHMSTRAVKDRPCWD